MTQNNLYFARTLVLGGIYIIAAEPYDAFSIAVEVVRDSEYQKVLGVKVQPEDQLDILRSLGPVHVWLKVAGRVCGWTYVASLPITVKPEYL